MITEANYKLMFEAIEAQLKESYSLGEKVHHSGWCKAPRNSPESCIPPGPHYRSHPSGKCALAMMREAVEKARKELGVKEGAGK